MKAKLRSFNSTDMFRVHAVSTQWDPGKITSALASFTICRPALPRESCRYQQLEHKSISKKGALPSASRAPAQTQGAGRHAPQTDNTRRRAAHGAVAPAAAHRRQPHSRGSGTTRRGPRRARQAGHAGAPRRRRRWPASPAAAARARGRVTLATRAAGRVAWGAPVWGAFSATRRGWVRGTAGCGGARPGTQGRRARVRTGSCGSDGL